MTYGWNMKAHSITIILQFFRLLIVYHYRDPQKENNIFGALAHLRQKVQCDEFENVGIVQGI